MVVCPRFALGRLSKLHRKFSIGDAVKVIAGPFSRETGHVVVVNKGLIVLVFLQDWSH